MRTITKKLTQHYGQIHVVGLAALLAGLIGVQAQWPPSPPTDRISQRNAMNRVLNQAKWLQSATRTSSSYGGGGYGNLQQQFRAVCEQWGSFKTTLAPEQLNEGGNQVAELDEGLNILSEAFTNYHTAVANGQSEITAYNHLRNVLNQGIGMWSRQFNQSCRLLRVG